MDGTTKGLPAATPSISAPELGAMIDIAAARTRHSSKGKPDRIYSGIQTR